MFTIESFRETCRAGMGIGKSKALVVCKPIPYHNFYRKSRGSMELKMENVAGK